MRGAGQVRWPAIDRYADRPEIDDPDAFDRFRLMVRAHERVIPEQMADAVMGKCRRGAQLFEGVCPRLEAAERYVCDPLPWSHVKPPCPA